MSVDSLNLEALNLDAGWRRGVFTRVLSLVRAHAGTGKGDASSVLCCHPWDRHHIGVLAAYHSIQVLRDEAYLDYVTQKLKNLKMLSEDLAACVHGVCDCTDAESVARTMMLFNRAQLEAIGI